MPKKRKLTWFRMYIQHKSILETLSSQSVGNALKIALEDFDKGGEDFDPSSSISDKETLIAFAAFRQGIDDSLNEYKARIEDGKRGAEEKKMRANETIEKLAEQYGGDEVLPHKPPWDYK